MQVLIAHDYSGSTAGTVLYHDTVRRILDDVRREVPAKDISIVLWDNNLEDATMSHYKDILSRRKGRGMTCPSLVARRCVTTGFTGHLILITDGEVGTGEIDSCDEILRKHQFAKVTCHVIQRHHPNASVTCPFTRNSVHDVFFHTTDGETRAFKITPEQLALDPRDIGTVEEFDAKYEVLQQVVVAKTMGTRGNLAMRDALLAMKQRLVASLRSAAEGGGGEDDGARALEVARGALAEGNYEAAIAAMRDEARRYYRAHDTARPQWMRNVDKLVAVCERGLRDAFTSGDVSTALDRAKAESAPAAPAVVEDESIVNKFECPISLDPTTDVVILLSKPDKPIMRDLPPHIANDIMVNPLRALNNDEVVSRIVSVLDHPIGLEAYRVLFGQRDAKSPMTRKKLSHGALTLATHPAHVQAANSALAQVLNGGKRAGNPDLWFAVILAILKREGARLEYLRDMIPFVTRQMEWRLQHSAASLSLAPGSPEFLNLTVPLGVACWYVLESPKILEGIVAPAQTTAEPLRFHMPNLGALRELVAMTGFRVTPESERHANRLRVMLYFRRHKGRNPAAHVSLIRGLYQDGGMVMGDLEKLNEVLMPAVIPLDGPPRAGWVEEVRARLGSPAVLGAVSDEELVSLSMLVGVNIAAKELVLPLSWEASPLPAASDNWHDPWKDLDTASMVVKICPATCRPFTNPDGRPWEEHAARAWGDKRRWISMHYYFGRFVDKYGRYPQGNELAVYVFNRKFAALTHDVGVSPDSLLLSPECTMPCAFLRRCKEVETDFKDITDSIAPDEFAKRFRASSDREERARLDGTAS